MMTMMIIMIMIMMMIIIITMMMMMMIIIVMMIMIIIVITILIMRMHMLVIKRYNMTLSAIYWTTSIKESSSKFVVCKYVYNISSLPTTVPMYICTYCLFFI